MTVDTLSYVKRLESAGVPRLQAEAHAEAMRAEIAPQVATKADLDNAVARLDMSVSLLRKDLDNAVVRLDQKVDTSVSLLRKDMDTHAQRMEALIWRAAFAILGGGLAVGGFLIRFVK